MDPTGEETLTANVESINPKQRHTLLNQLSELLPSLQQDPSPVTELIDRLISPESFTFFDALNIQPHPDFSLGLQSPASSINLVTLSLLEKAKYGLGDVNYVAGEQEIVSSLVRLWLCTEETAVAQRAGQVLTGLLLSGETTGQDCVDPVLDKNLMWRRIFRDKDIYETIFSVCSLSTTGQNGQPGRRHKTVAQGRLLDFLLVVHKDPVRTTQIPAIEARYGVKDGGLLEFAIVHMIDYNDDDLMLSTLINFCSAYLRTDSKNDMSRETPALSFLKKYGLHDSCISYYLQPTPSHPSWVLSDSARYLGYYCSCHTEDFFRDPHLPDEVMTILRQHLSGVSKGAWLSGRVPETDLMVLSLLPPSLVFLNGDKSILSAIPPVATHVSVLELLSTIFGCSAERELNDQVASRALYFLYLDEYPDFWTNITKAADTVALLEPALAANKLIGSIIDASWKSLPTAAYPEQFRPLEEEILTRRYNYGEPLPQTGIEAILSARAAGTVLPYLMKPAQTFSNAVGGGRGDVEGAAWKVAVAKHDLLVRFREKLKLIGGSPDMQSMIAAVDQRIAQGPMGGSSQVGGQVGTMEL